MATFSTVPLDILAENKLESSYIFKLLMRLSARFMEVLQHNYLIFRYINLAFFLNILGINTVNILFFHLSKLVFLFYDSSVSIDCIGDGDI